MKDDPINPGLPVANGDAATAQSMVDTTGNVNNGASGEAVGASGMQPMATMMEGSPSGGQEMAGGESTPNDGNTAQSSHIPDWMMANRTVPTGDLPHGSVVEPANTPKKKHTGLLVALIIIFLLGVAGIGTGVWFFGVHSNPEKVVFDAVDGFLHKKSYSVSGGGIAKTKVTPSMTANMSYMLNSKTTGTSSESNNSISINYTDENGETLDDYANFDIDVGNVFMSDGVFYLQVDKLEESARASIESQGLKVDDLEGAELGLYELLRDVDGKWWRVSVPELLDKIGESGQGSNEPVANLYTCAVKAAQQNIPEEMAKIYTSHRFLKAENVGRSLKSGVGEQNLSFGQSFYKVSLEYNELANFLNQLLRSGAASNFYDCYNDFIWDQFDQMRKNTSGDSDIDVAYEAPREFSMDDLPTIEASELEKSLDAVPDIYLMISDFTHELQGITYISTDADKDNEYSGYVTFDYAPVMVSAPESYRSVTELIDRAVEIIRELNTYDDVFYEDEDLWDEEDVLDGSGDKVFDNNEEDLIIFN